METQFFSLDEVSKNDGKSGNKTWIVIRDCVYDVTDFIDEHPGGGDLIVEWAGKDCTGAFEDVGHSSDAKKDLKKLKIGELREEDRKRKVQQKTASPADAKDKGKKRGFVSYLTCGICD